MGIASSVALGAAAVAGVLPRIRHRSRAALARELGLGALLGSMMALATHALATVGLGLIPGAQIEVRALYANLEHVPGPVGALPILAFAVVAEEVVWRGVAMDALRIHERPRLAILGAAALYALPQIASGSWLLLVIAVVCGLAWGAIRAWREGLAAPIATHFVWNLFVFVFWPIRTVAPAPF